MSRARTLLALAGLSLLALAPAEAKKVKTPKSENANVKQAVKQAKKDNNKYKASKYKAPKMSKKPPKSARVKYGAKSKS